MSDSFSRFRPHPWHGLETGPRPPAVVSAYIEITPFDFVKYELDKTTGYLRVDRPQKFSSQPPVLYGIVPQTYCDERVRKLMEGAERGDKDPLDICVVSERPIARSEVILAARVIGGLPMLDDGEADDKIISVLLNDDVWAQVKDIADLPDILVERIHHYFSTYKSPPGRASKVRVAPPYGREQALRVVQAAMDDYMDAFGVL